MIAAITFCFSMVALGQFGLYYWRASIVITADRQISDRVKIAAGIPAAPVTARDFRAILSVHDLTPELRGSGCGYRTIRAYYSIVEEIGRLSDYYRFRQPYRLPSFTGWDKKQPNILHRKLGYVSSFIVAFVVISAAAAPTALALLRSNVVALKNNSITVASAANQCSGNTTNNTSINVTNNSSQSSSSGSATSSGSGSAKSGNAGNSSSTSFGISVSNC